MLPPTLLLLATAALVSAAANYEPPDGKAFLSFWIDTTEQLVTPLKLENLINKKVSGFGLQQSIPIELDQFNTQKTANLTFIEETNTDALMFLTVYPSQEAGFNGISDADISRLADQLYNITTLSNRRVLLRYIPEMNGNWYCSYLSQPLRFKSEWARARTAIRARTTKVDFVWSPNYSPGYPYGTPCTCDQGKPQFYNAAECKTLDTTGDGSVDETDDAYSPYWVGADMTEWVGLSMYWKGGDTQKPANIKCTDPNTFGSFVDSGNFYQTYAVANNIPFAISETGAAFGVNFDGKAITTGDSQLDIEQSCWRTYVTSPAFFQKYPKVKYINFFEFEKLENATDKDTILRDFRLTNDPTVRAAFVADLAAFDAAANVYIYANATTPNAPGPGATNSALVTLTPMTNTAAPGKTTSASSRDAAGVVGFGTMAFVAVFTLVALL